VRDQQGKMRKSSQGKDQQDK